MSHHSQDDFVASGLKDAAGLACIGLFGLLGGLPALAGLVGLLIMVLLFKLALKEPPQPTDEARM